QQPQVGEQVDHLLLAVVAPPERANRRQSDPAQLLLVPFGVSAGGEQAHDLAGSRRALVDELADAARDRLRLGASPVLAAVAIARLVRHEQLDRMAEDGRLERAGGGKRLESVAE